MPNRDSANAMNRLKRTGHRTPITSGCHPARRGCLGQWETAIQGEAWPARHSHCLHPYGQALSHFGRTQT